MSIEFMEQIDKEREYKAYLTEHIAGVEKAFYRLIVPLKGRYSNEFDDAIDLCGQLVPLHDLSKLSKIEFDAYRKHFYPLESEKGKFEEDFEIACKHHISVNPHHPAFWCKNGVNTNMPLQYILEMICDWDSVSHHYDSSVVEFYDNRAEKEKSYFTSSTRDWVDLLVNDIFRKPGIKF